MYRIIYDLPEEIVRVLLIGKPMTLYACMGRK
jgi:hypothetical protein